MSKRKIARWVGVFLFGSVAVGSLGEHSWAFVPACVALCILIPPIDAKLASIAKEKGFPAYTKRWFKPAVVLTMFLLVGATLPKSQSTTDTSAIKSQEKPAETNTENTQKSPVYDLPSLLGKTTDELQTVLGELKAFTPPTKDQVALTSSWDMVFAKDGVELEAWYNVKTKAVEYLTLYGTDKKTLLAEGNLDEKSKDYILKFVQDPSDKNKYLGVKVAKRLPDELGAAVGNTIAGITVTNKEDQAWSNCTIKVNDSKYTYSKSWGVEAGETKTIAFSDLTKSDGTRFNIFETKPKDVYLRCDNAVQTGRYGYYSY